MSFEYAEIGAELRVGFYLVLITTKSVVFVMWKMAVIKSQSDQLNKNTASRSTGAQ
jgi:hypothetical protein